MDICSRAYELFEISKVEQKRQLINFVLSNLQLRGKTLEFELKKPFDVLVNIQNCKNRSEWLGREDSNQSYPNTFNRFNFFFLAYITINFSCPYIPMPCKLLDCCNINMIFSEFVNKISPEAMNFKFLG